MATIGDPCTSASPFPFGAWRLCRLVATVWGFEADRRGEGMLFGGDCWQDGKLLEGELKVVLGKYDTPLSLSLSSLVLSLKWRPSRFALV